MADSYVLTVEGFGLANIDTKPVSFPITKLSLLSMIPRTWHWAVMLFFTRWRAGEVEHVPAGPASDTVDRADTLRL